MKKLKFNNQFMRILSTCLVIVKGIRLSRLQKNRIVIFDRSGSDLVKKLILGEIRHTVLPVRNEVIYICPLIGILFIKNFLWIYLKYRKYRGFSLVYLYTCIEYVKPEIVITFIDNNSLFHAISAMYKPAKFYAIQNGVRNSSSIGKPVSSEGNGTVYSCAELFCFGYNDIDLYRKNGFIMRRFHPIGSFFGSYYRSQAKPVSLQYDLCLVSQWRRSIMLDGPSCDMKNAFVTLHGYLLRFVAEEGVSLCIARAMQDDEEMKYFRKIFGNDVHIINYDRWQFSTYVAMDASKVVVTFCSSAAYEAFGWGKKVLFCNFSGDPGYNFPKEIGCSVHDADYDLFKRRLTRLLTMDHNEYLRLTREASRYVMSYDSCLPAHMYAQKKILADLQESYVINGTQEGCSLMPDTHKSIGASTVI